MMEKQKQKQLITEIMNDDAKDGLYKRQTSVDWLISQISKPQWQSSMKGYIIEHAKQMHRKEIEKAYKDGFEDDLYDICRLEDYYTQTYGE